MTPNLEEILCLSTSHVKVYTLITGSWRQEEEKDSGRSKEETEASMCLSIFEQKPKLRPIETMKDCWNNGETLDTTTISQIWLQLRKDQLFQSCFLLTRFSTTVFGTLRPGKDISSLRETEMYTLQSRLSGPKIPESSLMIWPLSKGRKTSSMILTR